MGHLVWHLQWWERLAFAEGRRDLRAKGHLHHRLEVVLHLQIWWEILETFNLATKPGLPFSRELVERVGLSCSRLLESPLYPRSTIECGHRMDL